KRTRIFLIQKSNKRFQVAGLLPKEARRSYQRFQLVQRHFAHRGEAERAATAKIRDCLLNIAPVCVLREICAHNHFKSRLPGPPVLWAVAEEKGNVISGDLVTSTPASQNRARWGPRVIGGSGDRIAYL